MKTVETYKKLIELAALRATPTPLSSETEPQWRDSDRIDNGQIMRSLAGVPVRPSRPLAFRDAPVMAGPRGEPKGGATKWFRINGEISAEVKAEAVEIEIYDKIGKDWWSGEGVEAAEFAKELKKIPRGQEILLRVSSNGGSVNDGLLIYNLLKERSANLVCQIDSVAASIASVIVLAGRETRMPRNAKMMIHNPWSYAEGDANEMRRIADKLDVYRDSMAIIYQQKCGMPMEDIHKLMDAETWMTGDEAKKHKLCDTVTDEEPNFQACARLDFTGFKHVPEQLKTKNIKGEKMNREQIIARLNELGVTFDANASDEQLQSLLTDAEAQAKTKNTPKAKATPKAAPKAQPKRQPAGDDDEPEPAADDLPTDDPAHPQSRIRSRIDPAAFDRMQADLTAIRAERDRERKLRVERDVDTCVAEDRIPATQRDKWIKRILNAGEDGNEVLADLKAMPPRPPGTEPVAVIIENEDPKAVINGLMRLREPLASFWKGNNVDPRAIGDAAKASAMTIEANRKRLSGVLATNTIDPTLKRTVILQDVLRAFVRKLLMFNVFTTKYQVEPLLQGTNKIAVPFYDLDTVASTDYVAATGYTFAEDTTVGVREVTINKRKYKSMDFSSDTFRRQPYFQPEVAMLLKTEQLAVDVWTDFMSIVKATNYPTVALNREPGAFDSDDMATLMGKADDADWPEVGRAFVGGTGHKVALNQDDAIKHWQNSNSTDALRRGSVGQLSTFDVYFSPRIPTNDEDLAAFICLPPAAIFASAPILPAPGVRAKLLSYDIVVEPQTGIAIEYRYGADEWKDTDREVVECNYGYGKGNGSALQRITAGASQNSSSSSASSVNSSSSSSSSPSY